MSNQTTTNLADGTDPNYAVNFKQYTSLKDNVRTFVDKYIKQEVNLVGGVAGAYENIMAMPVLNVAASADLSSAVNFLQLTN